MMRAAAGLSSLLEDLAEQRKEDPGSPFTNSDDPGCLDETDWYGTFPHTARLLRHNYSGSRIENKLPAFGPPLKSNMLFNVPVIASVEPFPIRPRSQLSSMKRRIED